MPEPEHLIRTLADQFFARMVANEFGNFAMSHCRSLLDLWKEGSLRIVFNKDPGEASRFGHTVIRLDQKDFELSQDLFRHDCKKIPSLRTIIHRILENIVEAGSKSYNTPILRLVVANDLAKYTEARRRRVLEILSFFQFAHVKDNIPYDVTIDNTTASIAKDWNTAAKTRPEVVFADDPDFIPFVRYLSDLNILQEVFEKNP